MFGKKIEEIKDVDQVKDLNPSSMQRSLLIKRDLQSKKIELEGMDKKVKELNIKIETKSVLIASYKKEIVDSESDRDRILSKIKILNNSIHELEDEDRLYHSGTHKDLMSDQELGDLNFLEAAKTIKEFKEKEKFFTSRINSQAKEILDLKNKLELKDEVNLKSKKESKKLFGLFSKKEERDSNKVELSLNNPPKKTPITIKQTPKKSSKKLIKSQIEIKSKPKPKKVKKSKNKK